MSSSSPSKKEKKSKKNKKSKKSKKGKKKVPKELKAATPSSSPLPTSASYPPQPSLSPTKETLIRFDNEYKILVDSDEKLGISTKRGPYDGKEAVWIKRLKRGYIATKGLSGEGDIIAELNDKATAMMSATEILDQLQALSKKVKTGKETEPFTITFRLKENCKLALLHPSVTDLGVVLSSKATHLIVEEIQDSSVLAKTTTSLIGWSLVSINGRSLKGKSPDSTYTIIGSELVADKGPTSLRFESPEKVAQDIQEFEKIQMGAQTPAPGGGGGTRLLMTPVDTPGKGVAPNVSSPSTMSNTLPSMYSTPTAGSAKVAETGTTQFLNGMLNNHHTTSNSVKELKGMNIAPAQVPITLGRMHVTINKGKRFVKLNAM